VSTLKKKKKKNIKKKKKKKKKKNIDNHIKETKIEYSIKNDRVKGYLI